jgi:hypothetical protein
VVCAALQLLTNAQDCQLCGWFHKCCCDVSGLIGDCRHEAAALEQTGLALTDGNPDKGGAEACHAQQ